MDEYQNKLRNIIATHFTITESSEQGLAEAAQLVQHVADSFGGCLDCWGSGILETADSLHMIYCTCDRGKTLARLITINYLSPDA